MLRKLLSHALEVRLTPVLFVTDFLRDKVVGLGFQSLT
jgi:hypothetical protein